ncbi:fatty-acyl-CoA synthase [Bacillus oleivorans]|uniref:Fatty-acyl-CoA synthase n=1 Tax=Bacillus oleivorans TaxID=1448271 RepID=A0A285CPF8_9BACI|nr:o-succinylbenzoate--CoA ligase [Bacillus oleivorans]SNX69404.1 fatty-acyl-CoA synthase [Bacillus oleivorans]
MQGISYWIEKRAVVNPNRLAIITDQEQLTYKQLNQQIRNVSAFFMNEMKVKKGDRIGILSHNRLEYMVLLFAIAKIQCVAVPLNSRLNVNELVYQLTDSETAVLVIENAFFEMGKSIEKVTGVKLVKIESLRHIDSANEPCHYEKIDEHDPYIICYTSGTTGWPKGAVLTQSNMYWNAINNILGLDLTSRDKSIVLLPLFHIGGIGLFALPTLFTGGAVIIPGKFVPEKVISMIEKHQATIVMGVPTIHQALMDCPSFQTANLQSVRWFYSGGAPCPVELIQAFYDKGYLFGQGFGLTETSPTVFLLSREDAPRKIGSIGKPVMYCDYRLVDSEGNDVEPGEVGHLIIRGPNVMKEYWNKPKATKEAIQDGWFHTGDLARIDEEGFVYIVGRKKEMLISGGENIYPLEVEQVIRQLPEVQEVAVVGGTDPKWGEIPIAFIAKKESAYIEADTVISHCKQYLAKYKVPKEIHFVDELPKNATGKIQKNLLTKYDKQVK